MDIIYVSSTCSREKYAQYVETKGVRVSQQAQKYNLLLIEGLARNGARVSVVSTRPLNRNIEKRFWMRAEAEENVNGVTYWYLPFMNYPFLRNVWLVLGSFFGVLSGNKESVVICDALNVSATAGALAAAFLRRFRTVAIVTDVPCYFSSGRVSMNQKVNLALMRRFSSYLFLTEQMSEVVNPKKRPYIVLEGHADKSMADVANTLVGKAKKRVCMYAGSLMEIYGIRELVEGFVMADIPDTELHIYGSGDYEEKLAKLAEQHENVKYLGVAPNSEIVQAELAATLLVNPRPTNEEYTKYSFPSKNMEYMASGTPMLTTCLPGMPAEYNDYVFLLKNETSEGIAETLKEILSKTPEELHGKGLAAKKFVLREKNNVEQARKLLSFLKL